MINANFIGLVGAALSIAVFALTYSKLRGKTTRTRLVTFALLALLAVPSLLFAIYYLHLFPERVWFYTLRSWAGTEFLVVFLGGAGGAVASLLPRTLLLLPLVATIVLSIVPYVKPFLGPLPDTEFSEKWIGEACLQSTPSTCGPASVSTILRQFGYPASERDVAQAAYSYQGGTEAWYLARHVRAKGLVARFSFQRDFPSEAELPAVVGVRLGTLGHFIAVLEVKDGEVRFADPLRGEERLPISRFQQRYDFTAFRMSIAKH
jgi:Peptidase C39 family